MQQRKEMAMDGLGLTGDELRAFRARWGLSSRDLSRALKLPEQDGSRVRAWERGADRVVPLYIATIVEMVDQVPELRGSGSCGARSAGKATRSGGTMEAEMSERPQGLFPGFEARLDQLLKSGIDVNGYAVSAARVREVIQAGPGSDELKRQLLDYLETRLIKGQDVISCIGLGLALGWFEAVTDNPDVILISRNITDRNQVPFVIVNGKPVS
jgi:hypothetical protein